MSNAFSEAIIRASSNSSHLVCIRQVVPCAISIARFSNSPEPGARGEERRGRTQGDAYEDRKPRAQTSANEVKGIKRTRIFTREHSSDTSHISAASLPELAPFFLAVNARH